MFIRHRRLDRIGVKGKYATAKTILRIDHEQLSEVCCSLHRHHRRSVAACMAAQEQTPPWFHQPLQRNPTRVLRAIFLSGPAIAREKEIKGWRRSKKINLIESMNPPGRRSLAPLEKTRGFGMTPLITRTVVSCFLQTKRRVPDRIAIHIRSTMRSILPSLCSLLRSWTILPSGL